MNADKEKLIYILCGNINADHIFKEQEWLVKIIPEIKPMIGMEQYNPNHCYTIWEHTVYSIVLSPDNPILRLTMLFHDIGKPSCYSRDKYGIGHFYGHPKESCHIASQVLKRLDFGFDTLSSVDKLVFYHDAQIPSKAVSVRRWLNKLGEEHFKMLLEVKKADTKAQANAVQAKKLEKISRIEKKLSEVLIESQCFQKQDLAITGFDLIQSGISEGKYIGTILSQLVSLVREDKLANDKNQLLEMAKQLYLN